MMFTLCCCSEPDCDIQVSADRITRQRHESGRERGEISVIVPPSDFATSVSKVMMMDGVPGP